MTRKVPRMTSDGRADTFLQQDLSDLDFSQFRPVTFEFQSKAAELEAAEMEVLDVRPVTIPAEDWERFEAWVAAPAREVPALRRLASSRPASQD